MGFLEGLDFINHSGTFDVSYRASPDWQELSIEVETAGKATRRSGPVCVRKVIDMVNFGAAGGTHFAPADGGAERLRGPWDGADAFGPTYNWTLRVKGLAAEFLRLAVEHLRRCGWDQAVRSMRIRGELAPDRSDLSVTTERMRGWLGEGMSYPGVWRHADFTLLGEDVPGAALRIRLREAPTPEQSEALQVICARWLQATATIVGHDGSAIVRTSEQLERMLPTFSVNANVFTAEMSLFGHAAEPAAAMLANMLSRFHAQQAALESVTIGVAGLHHWPRPLAPPEPPRPTKPESKKAAEKVKKKKAGAKKSTVKKSTLKKSARKKKPAPPRRAPRKSAQKKKPAKRKAR